MHVPDGFLDAQTSVATGVAAVALVAAATRASRDELQESGAALAGLTGVFVFAAQMINFPVGAGTSGHLLGGTLAAVLVGPWTALLAMTVVLGVQALFFADGGLSALGTNVILMAVVPVLVGYGLAKVLARFAGGRPALLAAAAGIGAFVAVPSAALVFSTLYAAGGAVSVPMGQLVAAMLTWHLLIGVGEGLITAAVVGAVLASRPDLVHLARRYARSTTLVDASGAELVDTSSTSAMQSPATPPSRRWLGITAAVSLVIAGGLSMFASAHPDGLEFVAEQVGFAGAGTDSATAGSPLADYGLAGWTSALATGAAGIIGLALVATLAYLGAAVLMRVQGNSAGSAGPPEPVTNRTV